MPVQQSGKRRRCDDARSRRGRTAWLAAVLVLACVCAAVPCRCAGDASACVPWSGYPVECQYFYPPGTAIYVPANTSIADSESFIAQSIGELSFIAGLAIDPHVKANFSYMSIELLCMGYLAPCYPNAYNLSLPMEMCFDLCQSYFDVNVQFLRAIGSDAPIEGRGLYQYTWNSLPLNCSGWRNEPLGALFGSDIPSWPVAHYTVGAPGANGTGGARQVQVPCLEGRPYTTFSIASCTNDGFESEDFTCMYPCPMLPITTADYDAIQVLHLVLACCSIFVKLVYIGVCAVWKREMFVAFPHVLVSLACALGFVMDAAIIFPWVAGYQNVWCDGGQVYTLASGNTAFDSNGQAVYFFITIDGIAAHGGECSAQAFVLYWVFLELIFIATAVVVLSALNMWGIVFYSYGMELDRWPVLGLLISQQPTVFAGCWPGYLSDPPTLDGDDDDDDDEERAKTRAAPTKNAAQAPSAFKSSSDRVRTAAAAFPSASEYDRRCHPPVGACCSPAAWRATTGTFGWKVRLRSGRWWLWTASRVFSLPCVSLLASAPFAVTSLGVTAAGAMAFNVGSTFCFVDSTRGGLSEALWTSPILLAVLINTLAYVIQHMAMGWLVFVRAKARFLRGLAKNARITVLATFVRLWLQSTLVESLFLIVAAMTLYVSLATGHYNDTASHYIQCKVVLQESGCSVASDPAATTIMRDIALLSIDSILIGSVLFSMLLAARAGWLRRAAKRLLSRQSGAAGSASRGPDSQSICGTEMSVVFSVQDEAEDTDNYTVHDDEDDDDDGDAWCDQTESECTSRAPSDLMVCGGDGDDVRTASDREGPAEPRDQIRRTDQVDSAPSPRRHHGDDGEHGARHTATSGRDEGGGTDSGREQRSKRQNGAPAS